jgi:hypothetical protein
MADALSSKLLEKTVLALLVLGVAIKFYTAARLGESVIVQRGGGIIGSNHIAGIFLLLMPLAGWGWLHFLVILFLFFNFSRGIYIAYVFYIVAYFFLVNRRNALVWTCCAAAVCSLYLYSTRKQTVVGCAGPVKMEEFVESRARIDKGANINSVLIRTSQDQRFDLWRTSVSLARDSRYMGKGLGGFIFELKKMNYPESYQFSNAHSVYLNSLAEGGLLFALGLTAFIAWLLILSFRVDKAAFSGLLAWAVYGVYSGSIYVCGGFATAVDYYYLMWVAAFLAYKRGRMPDAEEVRRGCFR